MANGNNTDVRLYEIEGSRGLLDLVIENGQFNSVQGLDTAIDVSLLQDARASSEQVSNPIHAKGWPASSAIEDEFFGSLLWLLNQSRKTTTNLNAAIDYAQKSLSWMVRDRYASSIIVTGEISSEGFRLTININTTSGPNVRRQLDLLRDTA